MINEITGQTINEINSEIEAALKDVEKKFGVKIQMKNSRYTSENYSTKMEVALVQGGEVKTKIATDFERYREVENIPSDYEVGTRIRTANGTYMVIKGYDTKKRKYPILTQDRDKNYKLTVRQLLMSEVVNY